MVIGMTLMSLISILYIIEELIYKGYDINMSHRIFIAINLPQYIKDKFQEYQDKWYDLPVRWTKLENLHITLVFIGHISSDKMLDVCNVVKQTAQLVEPFSIRFKKILFGPPGKSPRMIWSEGELNEGIAKLKDALEENLLNSGNSGFIKKETRALHPHITLARIRQNAWRSLDEAPDISEDINLEFSVESIEVMDSQLSRAGSEYAVLESVVLG